MSSNAWFILILAVLFVQVIGEGILDYLNFKSRKQAVPKDLEGIYSPENYLKMQAYHNEHDRLGMLQTILSTVLSLGLILSGLIGKFSDYLVEFTPDPWYQFILFISIAGALNSLINLPFTYYSIFSIEERYGFNKTTLKTFVLDRIKSATIGLVILLPLSYAFIYIYQWLNNDFWWIAFALVFGIMLFVSMFYTSLLLPLFNKLKPLDEGELFSAIKKYCNENGFQLKHLYIMDGSKRSTKANAFFSGLGPRKTIVLFDTLIEKYSNEEIVAVLAHEVGHYKKKHTLQGLAWGAITMLLTFFVLNLFLYSVEITQALGAQHHTFHLSLIGFSMIYAPVSSIFSIVSNVLSRKNEYEADSFAAETYNGEALISALKKLSADSFSNLTPHPLYVFINYSHPTLLQRITNLRQ